MALLRASQTGQGKAIGSLSISLHEARKRIEELFQELEAASAARCAMAKDFETRLEELEQKWDRGAGGVSVGSQP